MSTVTCGRRGEAETRRHPKGNESAPMREARLVQEVIIERLALPRGHA